jgi:hypothetical protein
MFWQLQRAHTDWLHRLPFALLITPFERVVRSDGTRIVTAETLSTKMELKRIAKTMTSKLVMFSALWALWSFFYGSVNLGEKSRKKADNLNSGTWSTYLGTYFSVRARALSSLISPFFCMYVFQIAYPAILYIG